MAGLLKPLHRLGKPNVKLTDVRQIRTREALLQNNKPTPALFASDNGALEKIALGKIVLETDLYENPTDRWGSKSGMHNAGSSDPELKQTGETYWLDNKWTPKWVTSQVGELIGSQSDKHETHWRDLFADPLKWWDYRQGKGNSRCPDFKHKQTSQALWLDNRNTPSWVKSRLPGLQSDICERKWQDLFSEPSKWWDHRPRKENPKFPDFRHKITGEGLWMDAKGTPPWVASKIVSLGPGTLQLHIISSVQKLSHYNKAGHYVKTMELFEQMQQDSITPDHYIFLHVLKACASLGHLREGRRVHKLIIDTSCELNPYVSSSLVDMYAKCGSLEDARNVFNKMPVRNVVSWTAMILGHVNCGDGQGALQLFQQMKQEGVEPNSTTFMVLLKACGSMAALKEGRILHRQILQSDCELNVRLGSTLVDMYAKCGSIEDARSVFNKMPTRNVVSWTVMILGYVNCGERMEALELFQQMQREGVGADSTTFVILLNLCASIGALDDGRNVHKQIVQAGCELHPFVSSSLVNMYAKCGSLEEAGRIFNKMPTPDVVSWTSMILSCVNSGHGQKALELFQQMECEGVQPDSTTFVVLLNACASMEALEEGRRVHEQIVRSGCEVDAYIWNSLVDMYAKCGSIEDALSVFHKMPTRDVVSWTAMIWGFVNSGQGLEAFNLFHQMQQEGVEPNSITFVGLLNACASMAALEEGRRLHKQILKSNCGLNVYVGSALVDMYAKCGSIKDAHYVFQNMPIRNTVSWNAMIMGFAIHGLGKEAVSVFEEMYLSGSAMDEVTFVCLLSACSHGGLVKEGMHYFASMQDVYGVTPIQEHYTCMVDILGRAGHLDDAEAMVLEMPLEPCAAIWRSLLSSCRMHSNVVMGERAAKQVLKLDPQSSAGYVLLSNIYAASGNYESKDIVQELRRRKGVMKQPGRTWIEVNNEVHSFVVDDWQHPEIMQIHEELSRLSKLMKEAGYTPDTKFALHDTKEEKKVDHLSHHSEKLAIAYGLISTPAGAPLRIFKNLRVCGDCHVATKFIANIVGRTISVRDANRFHHFKEGHCSCGDYW